MRLFQTIREVLGLEFGSRIYAYSALVGIISGLAAVAFTYGLELSKFVCVELLAGFRQLHPEGRPAFDFSLFGTPVFANRL